jgi:hypothetical protein
MRFKGIRVFQLVASLMLALAIFSQAMPAAAADAPTNNGVTYQTQYVVYEEWVCNTLVHMEGTAYIEDSPNYYHVQYHLRAADGSFWADPTVTVTTRTNRGVTVQRLEDKFNIYKQGYGLFHYHNLMVVNVTVNGVTKTSVTSRDYCR